MKKVEAQVLVPDKSKVVIEYIESILSGNEIVHGKMNFGSYKIDGQSMCTLDIYVPQRNFEKHLNMGITSDHCDVLYKQLFVDFLSNFLEHDTIGVSRYFTIKYDVAQNFSGIHAINSMGSEIKINFLCKGQEFDDIVAFYNKSINEYVNGEKQPDEVGIGSR